MHVLIINFQLQDLDPAGYRRLTQTIAPRFQEVPGLIAKVWLADDAANTYGGVYFFENRPAIDAYLGSDLVRSLQSNPNFTAVSARVFEALDDPTQVTQGVLTFYPTARQPVTATPGVRRSDPDPARAFQPI